MRSIPPSLHPLLETATRRARIARLQRGLTLAGIGLAGAALAGGAALWWQPRWIEAWPVAAGLAGGLLAAVAVGAWFRPVRPRALLHELDRRLALPDSLLSAAELAGQAEASAWVAAQQSAALEAARQRTAEAGWSRLWPLPWPREGGLALGVLLVMSALFSALYSLHFATSYEGAAALGNPRRASAMEALFKDWEESFESPEEAEAMRALMAELVPLRERLENPKASEAEVFSDLNRLEEAVAARRKELESRSLEPHAAEMAGAMESVEGMSAMSAALRRGDFAAARDQAGQLAGQLGKEGQPVPKGAGEAAERMGQTGEKLAKAGQKQAADAMQQLSEGGKKGDRKRMQSGMERMQKALAGQCNANGECDRLGAQLAQLAALRAGLCEGKMPGPPPPLASLLRQPGGSSAGRHSGGELFGDATESAAARQAEQLTGTAQEEGESVKTTLQSDTGSSATATRRDVAQADFPTYERLSREAIADESLPAGHRQSIRDYFERIKPPSESRPR